MEGLIDRQKAINKIVFGIDDKAYFGDADIDWKVIDFLNSLPSVTPKEKTGKWIKTQSGDDMFPEIIVCSKCNNENSHLDFNEHSEPIGKVFIKSKYCPNCGARMVSE